MSLLPPATLIPDLRGIVHLLVETNYRGLAQAGFVATRATGELFTTPEDIARVVHDYGATLIDLPDNAFTFCRTDQMIHTTLQRQASVDARRVATFFPRMYEGKIRAPLTIPLWTHEEGKSHLTLMCLVSDAADRPVQMEGLCGFPPKLTPVVQEIVRRLISGDYAGCVPNERQSMMTAAQLAEQMRWLREEEGLTFVPIPDPLFSDHVRAYPRTGDVHRWAVDVDMGTLDEGRSDWTLQLEMWEDRHGIHVCIRDVHIL